MEGVSLEKGIWTRILESEEANHPTLENGHCRQEWGTWARLADEIVLICAGNCLQEYKPCTTEITKRTDWRIFFWKKKTIDICSVKTLDTKIEPETELPCQRETFVNVLWKLKYRTAWQTLPWRGRMGPVTAQLPYLPQNGKLCGVWKRRIVSMSTWQKALVCKAVSERVGSSLSLCSFLLRLMNSPSWRG